MIQITPDGHLFAYSADKGEKLLDVATGYRGMAPPVTYMLDGKQYIAFAGGMGAVQTPGPGGAPTPAGTIPVLPKLFSFVLDGMAPLPQVAAPPAPAR